MLRKHISNVSFLEHHRGAKVLIVDENDGVVVSAEVLKGCELILGEIGSLWAIESYFSFGCYFLLKLLEAFFNVW